MATSTKKHPLLPPGSILSMWREAADLLLTQDQGDPALLYLHIMRHANASPEQWDKARIRLAQEALDQLGLFPEEYKQEAKQVADASQKLEQQEPPQYSAQDLAVAMSQPDQVFSGLVTAIQQQLGKVLVSHDLTQLLTIYNYLGMPPEVMLMLVTHCISQAESKHGAGAKPTISQIKKEAHAWEREGITSFESANQHVQFLAEVSQLELRVLQIFHLQTRPLIQTERNTVKQWISWGFGDDILTSAYERTVAQTGNFEWRYCHGILKSWHQQGFQSLEQIKAHDNTLAQRPKQDKKKNWPKETLQVTENSAPSPEQGKRMEEDMEFLRKMLENPSQ